MNHLTYPCKTMRITQSYAGSYSHAPNAGGKPKDYPIDEGGADGGRDWFYCPCDEIVVARIAGVGAKATNAVWMTSTAPADMPCGKETVTIMVVHPEDDDLSKIKAGQKFTRGQQMFREGSDGNSSGNHFHISCGKGKLIGNGWLQNTQGAWVINTTGGSIKPEEAFYVDSAFTGIKNKAGIPFAELPKEVWMNTVRAGEFLSSMEAAAWQFVFERRGFQAAVSASGDKWIVDITGFPAGATAQSVMQSLAGLRCYSEIK